MHSEPSVAIILILVTTAFLGTFATVSHQEATLDTEITVENYTTSDKQLESAGVRIENRAPHPVAVSLSTIGHGDHRRLFYPGPDGQTTYRLSPGEKKTVVMKAQDRDHMLNTRPGNTVMITAMTLDGNRPNSTSFTMQRNSR